MPPKDAGSLDRQSLKAAIWYTVSQIVAEEEVSLGLPASEYFTGTLAELVFNQALSLGKDLESFAKHANRLTVSVEDVKLVARRNDALFELLSTEAQKNGVAPDALKIKPPKPRAKPTVKKAPAVQKDKPKAKGKGKEKEAGSDEDEAPDEDATMGGLSSSDDEALVKKVKAPKKAAVDKKKKL